HVVAGPVVAAESGIAHELLVGHRVAWRRARAAVVRDPGIGGDPRAGQREYGTVAEDRAHALGGGRRVVGVELFGHVSRVRACADRTRVTYSGESSTSETMRPSASATLKVHSPTVTLAPGAEGM